MKRGLVSLDAEVRMDYNKGGNPLNLNNQIGAPTTVQVSREVMTSNGCKVSMIFQSESDPKIEEDVAKMLIAAFVKRRSVSHEASIMPVQSIN